MAVKSVTGRRATPYSHQQIGTIGLPSNALVVQVTWGIRNDGNAAGLVGVQINLIENDVAGTDETWWRLVPRSDATDEDHESEVGDFRGPGITTDIFLRNWGNPAIAASGVAPASLIVPGAVFTPENPGVVSTLIVPGGLVSSLTRDWWQSKEGSDWHVLTKLFWMDSALKVIQELGSHEFKNLFHLSGEFVSAPLFASTGNPNVTVTVS